MFSVKKKQKWAPFSKVLTLKGEALNKAWLRASPYWYLLFRIIRSSMTVIFIVNHTVLHLLLLRALTVKMSLESHNEQFNSDDEPLMSLVRPFSFMTDNLNSIWLNHLNGCRAIVKLTHLLTANTNCCSPGAASKTIDACNAYLLWRQTTTALIWQLLHGNDEMASITERRFVLAAHC